MPPYPLDVVLYIGFVVSLLDVPYLLLSATRLEIRINAEWTSRDTWCGAAEKGRGGSFRLLWCRGHDGEPKTDTTACFKRRARQRCLGRTVSTPRRERNVPLCQFWIIKPLWQCCVIVVDRITLVQLRRSHRRCREHCVAFVCYKPILRTRGKKREEMPFCWQG